jgi:hypothetical protein
MNSLRSNALALADEVGIPDREAFATDLQVMTAEIVDYIRSGRGSALEAVEHVASKRGLKLPA